MPVESAESEEGQGVTARPAKKLKRNIHATLWNQQVLDDSTEYSASRARFFFRAAGKRSKWRKVKDERLGLTSQGESLRNVQSSLATYHLLANPDPGDRYSVLLSLFNRCKGQQDYSWETYEMTRSGFFLLE